MSLAYSPERRRAAGRIALASMTKGLDMVRDGRVAVGSRLISFGIAILDRMSAEGWGWM